MPAGRWKQAAGPSRCSGCFSQASRYFSTYLSQMMVSFRQKYPEVAFEIYTAVADDVKEQIENGVLELVWKKNQVFSPAAMQFIDWIKNAV